MTLPVSRITLLPVVLCFSWIYSAEIFVDHVLQDDCKGTYSIANRDNSGSDGDAYNTAQEAADSAVPGDVVYFREGVYYNLESTAQRDPVLHISKSGSENNPITYKNYQNEIVILSGEDDSGNASKFYAVSLGEKPSSQEDVSGKGVTDIIVEGLIVEGATKYGLGIFGPADKFNSAKDPTEDVIIRKVIARNNRGGNGSGGGIRTHGKLINVIIEYCEAYNNTGSGIGYSRIDKTWHEPEPEDDMSAAQQCIIRNCLTYNNIHPDYPGNTDGMGGSHMYQCLLENNVSFGNSDDGFDIYASINVTVASNIIFYHSYEGGNNAGLKFSAGGGGRHIIQGNIVLNNDSYSYEGSRPDNMLRNYYCSKLYNNVAYNGSIGFSLGNDYSEFTGFNKIYLRNNVALDNTNKDISGHKADWIDSDYNFISNADNLNSLQGLDQDTHSLSGDPLFVNKSIIIDTAFGSDWTIEKKLAHIRNQVYSAFSPLKDSPLIDSGVLVDGYHNSVPGDSSGENKKVWYGKAPDMGAVEFGTTVDIADAGKSSIVAYKLLSVKEQHSNVIISHTFTGPAKVLLLVHAVNGKCISALTWNVRAGSNTIFWDRTDKAGKRAGSGCYVVTCYYDNHHAFGRVLLLH